jgi:hypothetical protein
MERLQNDLATVQVAECGLNAGLSMLQRRLAVPAI